MKKYLFLLIAAMSAQITIAQYRPLPMQNAEWVNWGGLYLLSCPACTFVNYKYYTDGDTIINSTAYVKIKKTELPAINDVSIYPTYTGAIRQDTLNKKIYIVLADSTTERILYDFSLQVGDTINSVLHDLANNIGNCGVETIYHIDSILVNGNYHKIFYIQGGCGDMSLSFIEGIGSSYGLIFPNYSGQVESHLSCMKVNGQTYYPSNTSSCNLTNPVSTMDKMVNISDIDIYPNPTADELNIKITNAGLSFVSITISNTLGEIVIKEKMLTNEKKLDISTLPNGLYFLKLNSKENTITKKIIKQ
jgi:hypothetical protein